MIAERFTGAGTGAGAQSSSAFQNSLAQAGRGLTTDIAGLRAGLQGQAANQALGYAQQPYSNVQNFSQISPFAYAQQEGSQGLLNPILQGLGGAAGAAFGMGPLAGLFGGLGNMFGGGNPQSQRPVSQLTPGLTPGAHGMR